MTTSNRNLSASRWMAAVAVGLLTVVGTVGVATATEVGDDEVSRITNEVSEGIESPYCPGQTLAMCPSAQAAETRRDVQDMARDGKTADEIKDVLIDRYGAEYERHDPSGTDQMTLLGGILGGLAVAVGVVSFLARRRLRSDDGGDVGAGERSEDPGDIGDEEVDEDDPHLAELRAEVED